MVKGEMEGTNDEVPLMALIVADSFDRRFSPVLYDSSSMSNLRIANVPILHYLLAWLSKAAIRNVIIVVASAHEAAVSRFVEHWEGNFESLKLVSCRNCMSVGDAIREVDGRSLITSDFILITNPATFCSFHLIPQIRAYNERRKDKNNVMTLLYCEFEGSNPAVGYERKSNKLVYYHRSEDASELDIDKAVFIGDTAIRKDIRDTGIAICSPVIGSQFSDNFDFQYRDDIIREILVNEEILCQNIHIDILPPHAVAFTVSDYEGLLQANQLILQRWLTPFVPGRVGGERFIAQRNNVYFAVDNTKSVRWNLSRSHCATSTTSRNAVFGLHCNIATSAIVNCSSIGDSTVIEENAVVTNCIVGKNVRIGKNARIVGSFICDGVIIEDNVIVEPRCIIGEKVSITSSKILQSGSVLCCTSCDDDEEDIVCSKSEFGYTWKFADGGKFWQESSIRRHRNDSSVADRDIDSAVEKSDAEEVTEKELDNTEKFLEEVKESMERIAQEASVSEQLIRNLILEINSSKLAYNISMEDVARYVFLSFLCLRQNTSFSSIQTLATKWKLLFLNYYKPIKSQIQALIAIEEHLNATPAFKPMAAKTVHMFYNLDVLEEDAILEWYGTVSEDAAIRPLVAPIIEWLQEAEESEESD